MSCASASALLEGSGLRIAFSRMVTMSMAGSSEEKERKECRMIWAIWVCRSVKKSRRKRGKETGRGEEERRRVDKRDSGALVEMVEKI